MSIWGKIIGGAAGFALGGPLGGLLGVAAGHAWDADFRRRPQETIETRQLAFTTAVIALSAKMAKADGRVTSDELKAFKEVFHIPADELKHVGYVFDCARRSTAGYESYARQIAYLFRDSPNVLEDLLGALFYIARADHVMHPKEFEYLGQVANCFGFSEHHFEYLKFQFLGTPRTDPYSILGLAPNVSNAELRASYRRLIKENHPDLIISKGLPPEFIEIANAKLASINIAYDEIKKQRGLN